MILADVTAPPTRRRRRPTRQQVLLTLGFLVLLGGTLQGFFFSQQRQDQRVLVVFLRPEATAAQRTEVRLACGRPETPAVADQGGGAADLQARFPLRFSLRGATPAQEVALQSCLAGYPRVVRSFDTEGTP